MRRWIIFNFDGTWNGHDDKYATNVLRFHEALATDNQVSFYFAGPGNEDENRLLGRFLGGAFGVGSRSIRDAGYETLKAVYKPGDRIAVIGFSRGAAIARMFCAKIAELGVNSYKPDIYFLGVWDTVCARLPFGYFQQETLFGDLHVSNKVLCARHAVSIHEDRASFEPNLMNARPGIKEVWFRGNHTDVGGGYKARGLANITFNWMREEASGFGLQFRVMEEKASPCTMHREKKPLRRKSRKVGVKVDGEWSDNPVLIHPSAQIKGKLD